MSNNSIYPLFLNQQVVPNLSMNAIPNRQIAHSICAFLQFLLVYMAASVVFANPSVPLKQNLVEMPLEELMQIKISTVSRKLQTVNETAAAVFVISQEDIRRSSANSIPELLRMAPGLSVARIDGNKWSVTSRGDSGRFADDDVCCQKWSPSV